MDRNKIQLNEVTIIRVVMTILIVFVHSFTCYNGGWPEPKGFVDIPVYKWFSRLSCAFTLEAFVFISGYLFSFQRVTLNKFNGGGILLIVNKLKRLILPSVIFSIVYFMIFFDYTTIGNAIYSVLNGCGHMWFLPMLFWCFVCTYIIEKIPVKDVTKLLCLALINIFNITVYLQLPFQLSRSFNFMFYFYLGYFMYQRRDKAIEWLNKKKVIIAWAIFCILFIIFRNAMDLCVQSPEHTRILNLSLLFAKNLCHIIYSLAGLLAFYSTALFCSNRSISHICSVFATCSFGIYLFQQFILQILYYKTDFPVQIGPYLLPWVSFTITLVMSFLFSVGLRKTKIGRYLIG